MFSRSLTLQCSRQVRSLTVRSMTTVAASRSTLTQQHRSTRLTASLLASLSGASTRSTALTLTTPNSLSSRLLSNGRYSAATTHLLVQDPDCVVDDDGGT